MQVVTISGNVGRDAEVRQAGNGTVCSFSVACNEKGRNGAPDETTWYRVSVWGRRGEGIAPYIRKGARVTVCGRLKLGLYTGNDGQARIDADVTADEIDFSGGGRQDGQPAQPTYSAEAPQQYGYQPQPAQAQQPDMYDEDIPF